MRGAMNCGLILMIGVACSVTCVHADVISAAANGFEVRETVHVNAAPDKAFATLIQPARWWSSDHTFSGNAANLTLDAHAGGCWCESLPDGGSVEHLHVVYFAPGKTLRMRGALGPLQPLGLEGAMSMSVKPSASGADITISYTVGGYLKEGFEPLAAIVDKVLGDQAGRLKHLLDAAPG